jgi:gliding motility-associated-like protein
MVVSEAYNNELPKTFMPSDSKEFWTCGGEVSIKTTYTSVDANNTPLNDFKWYLGNTLQGSGSDMTIADMSNFETRTYRLEYTNKCKTSVEVTVHSVPLKVTPTITPKMSICEGTPFTATLNVDLHASETNYLIAWTKDGVPYSNAGKTLQFNTSKPEDSGLYSYQVTNRGCVRAGNIKDTEKLYVKPQVQIGTVSASRSTICEGDTVQLNLSGYYPSDATLLWNNKTWIIGDETNSSVQVIPPYTSGSNHRSIFTYTVTISDPEGLCTSQTNEKKIEVDEPLSGHLQDKPICEGDQVTFDALDYEAANYIWTSSSDPSPKYGATQTPSPRPLVTTTYYVSMDRGECRAADSLIVTVNSYPRILRIDSIEVRTREIITMEGFGTEPFTYAVDQRAFDDDAFKYDLKFGSHQFHVIDAYGCRSTAFDYTMDPPKIFIPDFFSPNGDGKHDTWEVSNLSEIYPNSVVKIYDRFGKELIQYRGSDAGWDGKYLGKDMPTTDYWYVIDIEEIDKQYVGHFTLLRK